MPRHFTHPFCRYTRILYHFFCCCCFFLQLVIFLLPSFFFAPFCFCCSLCSNATYLEDSETTVEGLKFYGTPWTNSSHMVRSGGGGLCLLRLSIVRNSSLMVFVTAVLIDFSVCSFQRIACSRTARLLLPALLGAAHACGFLAPVRCFLGDQERPPALPPPPPLFLQYSTLYILLAFNFGHTLRCCRDIWRQQARVKRKQTETFGVFCIVRRASLVTRATSATAYSSRAHACLVRKALEASFTTGLDKSKAYSRRKLETTSFLCVHKKGKNM